jgi:hypothetical protein
VNRILMSLFSQGGVKTDNVCLPRIDAEDDGGHKTSSENRRGRKFMDDVERKEVSNR